MIPTTLSKTDCGRWYPQASTAAGTQTKCSKEKQRRRSGENHHENYSNESTSPWRSSSGQDHHRSEKAHVKMRNRNENENTKIALTARTIGTSLITPSVSTTAEYSIFSHNTPSKLNRIQTLLIPSACPSRPPPEEKKNATVCTEKESQREGPSEQTNVSCSATPSSAHHSSPKNLVASNKSLRLSLPSLPQVFSSFNTKPVSNKFSTYDYADYNLQPTTAANTKALFLFSTPPTSPTNQQYASTDSPRRKCIGKKYVSLEEHEAKEIYEKEMASRRKKHEDHIAAEMKEIETFEDRVGALLLEEEGGGGVKEEDSFGRGRGGGLIYSSGNKRGSVSKANTTGSSHDENKKKRKNRMRKRTSQPNLLGHMSSGSSSRRASTGEVEKRFVAPPAVFIEQTKKSPHLHLSSQSSPRFAGAETHYSNRGKKEEGSGAGKPHQYDSFYSSSTSSSSSSSVGSDADSGVRHGTAFNKSTRWTRNRKKHTSIREQQMYYPRDDQPNRILTLDSHPHNYMYSSYGTSSSQTQNNNSSNPHATTNKKLAVGPGTFSSSERETISPAQGGYPLAFSSGKGRGVLSTMPNSKIPIPLPPSRQLGGAPQQSPPNTAGTPSPTSFSPFPPPPRQHSQNNASISSSANNDSVAFVGNKAGGGPRLNSHHISSSGIPHASRDAQRLSSAQYVNNLLVGLTMEEIVEIYFLVVCGIGGKVSDGAGMPMNMPLGSKTLLQNGEEGNTTTAKRRSASPPSSSSSPHRDGPHNSSCGNGITMTGKMISSNDDDNDDDTQKIINEMVIQRFSSTPRVCFRTAMRLKRAAKAHKLQQKLKIEREATEEQRLRRTLSSFHAYHPEDNCVHHGVGVHDDLVKLTEKETLGDDGSRENGEESVVGHHDENDDYHHDPDEEFGGKMNDENSTTNANNSNTNEKDDFPAPSHPPPPPPRANPPRRKSVVINEDQINQSLQLPSGGADPSSSSPFSSSGGLLGGEGTGGAKKVSISNSSSLPASPPPHRNRSSISGSEEHKNYYLSTAADLIENNNKNTKNTSAQVTTFSSFATSPSSAATKLSSTVKNVNNSSNNNKKKSCNSENRQVETADSEKDHIFPRPLPSAATLVTSLIQARLHKLATETEAYLKYADGAKLSEAILGIRRASIESNGIKDLSPPIRQGFNYCLQAATKIKTNADADRQNVVTTPPLPFSLALYNCGIKIRNSNNNNNNNKSANGDMHSTSMSTSSYSPPPSGGVGATTFTSGAGPLLVPSPPSSALGSSSPGWGAGGSSGNGPSLVKSSIPSSPMNLDVFYLFIRVCEQYQSEKSKKSTSLRISSQEVGKEQNNHFGSCSSHYSHSSSSSMLMRSAAYHVLQEIGLDGTATNNENGVFDESASPRPPHTQAGVNRGGGGSGGSLIPQRYDHITRAIQINAPTRDRAKEFAETLKDYLSAVEFLKHSVTSVSTTHVIISSTPPSTAAKTLSHQQPSSPLSSSSLRRTPPPLPPPPPQEQHGTNSTSHADNNNNNNNTCALYNSQYRWQWKQSRHRLEAERKVRIKEKAFIGLSTEFARDGVVVVVRGSKGGGNVGNGNGSVGSFSAADGGSEPSIAGNSPHRDSFARGASFSERGTVGGGNNSALSPYSSLSSPLRTSAPQPSFGGISDRLVKFEDFIVQLGRSRVSPDAHRRINFFVEMFLPRSQWPIVSAHEGNNSSSTNGNSMAKSQRHQQDPATTNDIGAASISDDNNINSKNLSSSISSSARRNFVSSNGNPNNTLAAQQKKALNQTILSSVPANIFSPDFITKFVKTFLIPQRDAEESTKLHRRTTQPNVMGFFNNNNNNNNNNNSASNPQNNNSKNNAANVNNHNNNNYGGSSSLSMLTGHSHNHNTFSNNNNFDSGTSGFNPATAPVVFNYPTTLKAKRGDGIRQYLPQNARPSPQTKNSEDDYYRELFGEKALWASSINTWHSLAHDVLMPLTLLLKTKHEWITGTKSTSVPCVGNNTTVMRTPTTGVDDYTPPHSSAKNTSSSSPLSSSSTRGGSTNRSILERILAKADAMEKQREDKIMCTAFSLRNAIGDTNTDDVEPWSKESENESRDVLDEIFGTIIDLNLIMGDTAVSASKKPLRACSSTLDLHQRVKSKGKRGGRGGSVLFTSLPQEETVETLLEHTLEEVHKSITAATTQTLSREEKSSENSSFKQKYSQQQNQKNLDLLDEIKSIISAVVDTSPALLQKGVDLLSSPSGRTAAITETSKMMNSSSRGATRPNNTAEKRLLLRIKALVLERLQTLDDASLEEELLIAYDEEIIQKELEKRYRRVLVEKCYTEEYFQSVLGGKMHEDKNHATVSFTDLFIRSVDPFELMLQSSISVLAPTARSLDTIMASSTDTNGLMSGQQTSLESGNANNNIRGVPLNTANANVNFTASILNPFQLSFEADHELALSSISMPSNNNKNGNNKNNVSQKNHATSGGTSNTNVPSSAGGGSSSSDFPVLPVKVISEDCAKAVCYAVPIVLHFFQNVATW